MVSRCSLPLATDQLMTVWANNGDMLSLCYAHTSALKGDFVRTGKRDIQGMVRLCLESE
jgi:hypothetical protein